MRISLLLLVILVCIGMSHAFRMRNMNRARLMETMLSNRGKGGKGKGKGKGKGSDPIDTDKVPTEVIDDNDDHKFNFNVDDLDCEGKCYVSADSDDDWKFCVRKMCKE